MRTFLRSSPLVVALALTNVAIGDAAQAQPPEPPPLPGMEAGVERVVITRGLGARPPERSVPGRSVLGLWVADADSLGVRLDRVAADGPAGKAGVVAGERIVSVNGTSLRVDGADERDVVVLG